MMRAAASAARPRICRFRTAAGRAGTTVHWSDSSAPPAGRLHRDDDNDDEISASRPVAPRSSRSLRPAPSSLLRPLERIRAAPPRGPSLFASGFPNDGGGDGGGFGSAVRSYHSTSRTEILPLVALVVVGLTARYSYRALVRMDEEWEEYEEAMREYRAAGGEAAADSAGAAGGASVPSSRSSSAAAAAGSFRDGVMGIDLGTVHLRISHAKGRGGGGSGVDDKPGVVVDREGGRSTPAYVYFDDTHGGSPAVWGRMAAAKIHERADVLSPHRLLMEGGGGGGDGGDEDRAHDEAVAEVIWSACRNALDQVLPSSSSSSTGSGPSPLFAVDPSATGGYSVRPAFAYPPVEDGNTGEWDPGYVSRYQRSVASLSSPPSIAAFVPEPVAAVAGARKFGVLPPAAAGGGAGTVLVLDVGGTVSSASLVSHGGEGDADDVLESLRLPGLGGEALVEALVHHVARGFFDVRDAGEVKDGMALQRLYDAARGGVMEVSGGKVRVQINVPYLTVDADMRPKHLDVGVSAKVLEAEVDDLVKSRAEEYGKAGVLSESVPPPGDLSSAFSSLVMRVLEEGGTNPFALEAVLVVGGGARSPIVQQALKRGLASIAGEQFVQEKVIVPKDELVEELVVLGAAVVGGRS